MLDVSILNAYQIRILCNAVLKWGRSSIWPGSRRLWERRLGGWRWFRECPG